MFRLLTGLTVCLLIFACKKDKTVATVSGNITLTVKAVHHTWGVANIPVYIEKGATEFPGTDSSVYDRKIIADGYGVAEFENLPPGQYYIYASGFDVVWNDNVRGHQPVSLTPGSLDGNTLNVTLYVSE